MRFRIKWTSPTECRGVRSSKQRRRPRTGRRRAADACQRGFLRRPLPHGNSHSAAPTPDSGPEPDTGRGAPRTPPANRARCTVARPRRSARATAGSASPAAGCHGSRAIPRNTRQPRQPSRPYHYGEGLRGQDHAGRRCPWLPRRLARPGTQALGCGAHSQISPHSMTPWGVLSFVQAFGRLTGSPSGPARASPGPGPRAESSVARRARWASHGSTARRTTSGASSRTAPRAPSARCALPPPRRQLIVWSRSRRR